MICLLPINLIPLKRNAPAIIVNGANGEPALLSVLNFRKSSSLVSGNDPEPRPPGWVTARCVPRWDLRDSNRYTKQVEKAFVRQPFLTPHHFHFHHRDVAAGPPNAVVPKRRLARPSRQAASARHGASSSSRTSSIYR